MHKYSFWVFPFLEWNRLLIRVSCQEKDPKNACFLSLDVSIFRMFYNWSFYFLLQEIRWDLVVIHGQISQSTVSKLRPSELKLYDLVEFQK